MNRARAAGFHAAEQKRVAIVDHVLDEHHRCGRDSLFSDIDPSDNGTDGQFARSI